MAHHVIFIPGLGDDRTFGQDSGIQLWRCFGLKPHYLALGWKNPETFAAKEARVIDLIDRLHREGHTVSLVGVSAGASAVLNVFAQAENVHKVVCISGKIGHPDNIHPRIKASNPDFAESMRRLSESLRGLSAEKRQRILTVSPQHDQTVQLADQRVEGATAIRVRGRRHATGIFFGIIFGSRRIARFIRS